MRKPDTRKGDRHRPGYWVEYGRKRRAREREAPLHPPIPQNRRESEMWLEEVISRVERAIAENQHQKWLYDEQAVALCDPNRIRRSKEWLRKAALAAIEEVYAKAPSPHKEVEDDPDAP